jgi:response regulator RpfG family c-di-GMP phosphodiesterase
MRKEKKALTINPETKDIPTIFLTSIIKKSEQKDIGQLSGGNIIIAKPYSSKELSEVIEKTFVNSPNDSKSSF